MTGTGAAAFRADPRGWIAGLCGDLRAEGMTCSLSESVLASEAAVRLDPRDPEDVRLGLRAAFCSSRGDLETFDRCFRRRWAADEETARRGSASPSGPRSGAAPESRGHAVRAPAAGSPAGRGESEGPPRPERVGTAWSPAHALARRSFADVPEHEVREIDRWIERLIVRLSARRSRRLEPGGRRGPLDLRRTARSAVRTEGEWIRLARRRRRRHPPRLVVLCDVSGSMERYSRFLVRFLLAAGRAQEIQTFAFSTQLTHLTPWLLRTGVDEALAALRARGWSSGTRIGECLETFLERYGRTMLGRRTIVIILSDGLDQGEVEPLERAMRRLARRARKIVWLNPLLESSRYAPEAKGMRAALPYVDEFASGHSLAALARLPALLRL